MTWCEYKRTGQAGRSHRVNLRRTKYSVAASYHDNLKAGVTRCDLSVKILFKHKLHRKGNSKNDYRLASTNFDTLVLTFVVIWQRFKCLKSDKQFESCLKCTIVAY